LGTEKWEAPSVAEKKTPRGPERRREEVCGRELGAKRASCCGNALGFRKNRLVGGSKKHEVFERRNQLSKRKMQKTPGGREKEQTISVPRRKRGEIVFRNPPSSLLGCRGEKKRGNRSPPRKKKGKNGCPLRKGTEPPPQRPRKGGGEKSSSNPLRREKWKG